AATTFGLLLFALTPAARAELPSPVLNTIFPAGGRAGTSGSVTVDGSGLGGVTGPHLAGRPIPCKKGEGQQITLVIPSDLTLGLYDVRAVGRYGLSGPRAFFIGNRDEQIETEPNDRLEIAERVALDCVVNGRLDKPADIDCYSFKAQAGRRVVL